MARKLLEPMPVGCLEALDDHLKIPPLPVSVVSHSATSDAVTQNIIASTSSSPTAFDNISGGSSTINNNFFMDLINSNFQTNGLAQTNAHHGNAQFANEASGNYALGSTSGAWAIGFTQINQGSMGLHPSTAHWYA